MRDWLKRRIEGLLDSVILAGFMAGGAIVWSIVSKLPTPLIFVIGLAVFALILSIFAIIRGKLLKKGKNEALQDIPKIIYEMHERLASLVASKPILTKTEIGSLRDAYLELWGMGESCYPELRQITPTSDVKADRKVLEPVLDKLLQTLTEVDNVKTLLIRTGGLMNVKGAGISQMRDKDKQYARLERRLAKVRPEIPTKLNTAIDNYLQFSFGSNSLYRFILSVPYGEITNALPPKYGAEMGIWKERMDTAMNELLAEVNGVIRTLAN